MIDILKNDLNLDRSSKEQKFYDRIDKLEIGGERAIDEIVGFKE